VEEMKTVALRAKRAVREAAAVAALAVAIETTKTHAYALQ
jgi:Flp pilus assembly protein TadG